jgi:hypothetical protein
VDFPLGSTPKRFQALFVSVVVAASVFWQAGKIWQADHLSRSANPADWLRAAETEPGNGSYWHRLGAYRQWNFEAADLNLALEYDRKALQAEPGSSLFWMDLAGVYEAMGETPQARAAFDKARANYPISAEVGWNYGNFLVRQGQVAQGFAEIHRALLLDPGLIPLAVSRGWQASQDANRLLDEVLPANPDAYFQAIDYFASNQEVDAGLKIWNRLLGLGKPFSLRRTFPFLDELNREERTDDAKRVWRQAFVAAGVPFDQPPSHSLVWNGGFEHDFANGGFDWREEDPSGWTSEFDTTTFHSGARSLRIDFGGGTNLNFSNVWELVPVEPNARYHFRGYLRADSISTESGLRFRLFDPQHGGSGEAQTPDLTGTQPWTALETDVTCGPETHLLVIQLRRLPSRLFDNKISGTVWVDDVSMTLVAQNPQPASP